MESFSEMFISLTDEYGMMDCKDKSGKGTVSSFCVNLSVGFFCFFFFVLVFWVFFFLLFLIYKDI